VRYIQKVIKNLRITSVLDVGHGDWKMWDCYRFENVQYTGVDVVEELSSKLQQLYGNKTRNFFR
jgi:hypothetical protein